MVVENEFTRALDALVREKGGEMPKLDDNGTVTLSVGGVALSFVCGDGEPGYVYCHAVVGSLEGLEHADRVLEDLLQANFFWRGTEGGTLSVLEETNEVMLADRRVASFFETAEDLLGYAKAMAACVADWREHLDAYRPKPVDGKEVQA